MNRFKLEQSEDNGKWILTDTENKISISFVEHKFNETQKVEIEDEQKFLKEHSYEEMSHIMKEMGDWMVKCHYSIAMDVPTFEIKEEDGKTFIIRNKFPKIKVEVMDDCTEKQISDALKTMGEFIKRYKNGR